MSQVVLHLGLAKTASSWLQQEVFPAMDADFYLCSDYSLLNKKISGTTIFSFEGLSGTPWGDDRYIIAHRLHKLFPNAKIIVGFRNQERYLKSLYSQYLKGGGIIEYDKFRLWIVSRGRMFNDWELYKDYLVRLWGVENCYFFDFEEMKKNKAVFLYRLSSFIGVLYTGTPNCSVINKSLNERQKAIWMRTNRYFKSKWNSNGVFPRVLNPCLWMKVIDIWSATKKSQ